MNAVMIVVKVLDESRVDRLEGFVFLPGKELLSDRAGESFHFGSALWTPDRRVGLLHGQIGANTFQVAAVISRPIVRIQAMSDAVAPVGGHQFDNQALARFCGIKPCTDHIAGAGIDDGMQIDFAFFLACIQFGAMHEVCDPHLTEFIEFKGSHHFGGNIEARRGRTGSATCGWFHRKG